MTRQDVLSELKKVLAPYTENKAALNEINDQTDLIKDLRINSSNLVDIIIDTESRYNIEIDTDAAERISNVGACIDVIMAKMEQKV